MPEDLFCPIHERMQEDLRDIKLRQDARKCVIHESDINHLREGMGEVKLDNREQWVAINKLRWVVAMGAGGAGVLAFLGSIIGAWLKK